MPYPLKNKLKIILYEFFILLIFIVSIGSVISLSYIIITYKNIEKQGILNITAFFELNVRYKDIITKKAKLDEIAAYFKTSITYCDDEITKLKTLKSKFLLNKELKNQLSDIIKIWKAIKIELNKSINEIMNLKEIHKLEKMIVENGIQKTLYLTQTDKNNQELRTIYNAIYRFLNKLEIHDYYIKYFKKKIEVFSTTIQNLVKKSLLLFIILIVIIINATVFFFFFFSQIIFRLVNDHAKMRYEMRIAEKVQKDILPKRHILPGYSISAFMKPAELVGGDFYDIIEQNNDNECKYWITIGDVMGHGLESGLIMMMMQVCALSLIKNQPDIEPSNLVLYCNKIIYNILNKRLLLGTYYITACFLQLNEKGDFTFAGPHLPVLIYRKETKTVEILNTKGMLLGAFENIKEDISSASFCLQPGDFLFIYTDGTIEILNKNKEYYGYKRLVNFFKKHGDKDPDIISNLLFKELNQFNASKVQLDDITYLIIKKK